MNLLSALTKANVISSFAAILLFSASVKSQTVRYAVANGNWNSTATWSATSGGAAGASVPVAGSIVIIEQAKTVTITANAACASVTVGNTTAGTLRFNVAANRTLTVSANLTVANGTFNVVDAAGTRTHTLNIGGNLAVAAGTTFNMVSAGNDKCNVNFNGTAAGQVINGGGAVTFNNISARNTNTAGVAVNTAATVSGTAAVNANCLLAAGAPVTFNGNVTVTGSFKLNTGGSIAGTGTWTYGAAASLVFNTTAVNAIGGTTKYWPATRGPRNVSILQGGIDLGSPTVASRTVTTAFQTAGSVKLSNASVLTINGTCTVNAGGTFLSAPTFGTASTLIYNAGNVYGRGKEWSAQTGAGYPNNVTINAGTSLDLGANGGTALAFKVAKILTINGSLLMDNDANDMTQPLTVGTNIIIGNTGILSLSDIAGGNLNITGSWTRSGAGIFNPKSRVVTFTGGNTTVTGSTTFDNLVLNKTNNGNTLQLAAGTDITVSQDLTLTKGRIDARTNSRKVICNGTTTGGAAASYINGNLQKNISATGVYFFPVGDASRYTPASVDFTNVTVPGALVVGATATLSTTPGIAGLGLDAANAINRYWSVNKAPASLLAGTYTATCTFINGATVDKLGTFTALQLRSGLYNGVSWAYPGKVTAATATTLTAASTSSFGNLVFASQKKLTVTGAVAQSKTYDGTTAAVIAGTITGVVSPDVVIFSGTGNFASALPGSGIAVVSACTISGANADNYILVQPAGLTANIYGINNGIADFRTKSGGNFSAPSIWQYDMGGGTWVDAPTAPGAFNNIRIRNTHIVTQDIDFTVTNGKQYTIEAGGSLTVAPNAAIAAGPGGTLDFNNQPVTFRSTATGTASLGKISGTLSGETNVTVERYIPVNAYRSYRLLSVPTRGSQTIRQSWMEGDVNPLPQQDNLPGYGTLITGKFNTAAEAAALGFDTLSPLTSIRGYNGTAFAGLESVNVPIETTSGYFLYVRGERSQGVSESTLGTTPTTLRTKGTLYKGDIVLPVAADNYTVIGNLYPSAIDFTDLVRSGGVDDQFFIWDSKKLNAAGTGFGAYETFSAVNGYQSTVGGGSWSFGETNTLIQSGQAFMVHATGTAGNVTLTENSKRNGSSLRALRPAKVLADKIVKLNTRLFAITGKSESVLDGNVVVFDAAYSNAVDGKDALKPANPGENFAVQRNNKMLVVEARQDIAAADTIQFNMWNMQKQQYRLDMIPSNLHTKGLHAVLHDNYLGTDKRIALDTVTSLSFTVDANAASAATGRFRIIVSKEKTLPVTGGVKLPADKPSVIVSPSLVQDNTIHIRFGNAVKGRYEMRLLNTSGQLLFKAIVDNTGGNSDHSIMLPASVKEGIYNISVIAPGKAKFVEKIFISGSKGY